MTPKEVLAALPRQKLTHWGKTYEVLCLSSHEIPSVHVIGEDGKPTIIFLENCTPVPEEPRPFRIGDKVVYEYEDGSNEYATIIAIRNRKDGTKIYAQGDSREGAIGKIENYRFATPEEIAEYFN